MFKPSGAKPVPCSIISAPKSFRSVKGSSTGAGGVAGHGPSGNTAGIQELGQVITVPPKAVDAKASPSKRQFARIESALGHVTKKYPILGDTNIAAQPSFFLGLVGQLHRTVFKVGAGFDSTESIYFSGYPSQSLRTVMAGVEPILKRFDSAVDKATQTEIVEELKKYLVVHLPNKVVEKNEGIEASIKRKPAKPKAATSGVAQASNNGEIKNTRIFSGEGVGRLCSSIVSDAKLLKKNMEENSSLNTSHLVLKPETVQRVVRKLSTLETEPLLQVKREWVKDPDSDTGKAFVGINLVERFGDKANIEDLAKALTPEGFVQAVRNYGKCVPEILDEAMGIFHSGSEKRIRIATRVLRSLTTTLQRWFGPVAQVGASQTAFSDGLRFKSF